MILPGISGSFMLLILGQYDFVLTAVSNRDLPPVINRGLGRCRRHHRLFTRAQLLVDSLLQSDGSAACRLHDRFPLEDLPVEGCASKAILIAMAISAACWKKTSLRRTQHRRPLQ